MTGLSRLIGLAVALAATLGIAWASNAELTPPHSGSAMLRLSWSARPERLETCRTPSQEEEAKLPAHMRQSEICEGTSAVYRLEVFRDGQRLIEELVRGGGLRHDRPLYVSQDIPQPPGDATIILRFVRVDSSDTARRKDQIAHREHDEGRNLDLPRSLAFERRLHFSVGSVILVTYDPERRELLAVEGTGR